MKIRKKISMIVAALLCVLICMTVCVAFSACGETEGSNPNEHDYLTLELKDNTYTVTGVKDKNVTEIVVPDSFGGIAVTAIADEAFANCASLTKAVLPESAVTLGKRIFSGCRSLADLTIAYTGAGRDASATRSSLGYMFGQTSYAGSVETTQYFGPNAEDYDVYYIPSALKKVTFTGETIPYGAFYNCSGIDTFVVGESVTSIGDAAFANNSLTFLYVRSAAIASSLTGAKACGGLLSNSPAVGVLDGITTAAYGVTTMDAHEAYTYADDKYELYTDQKEYRFEAESCDYFSALAPAPEPIGANGVPTSGGYYLGGFYPNGGGGEAYMEFRIWSHKEVTVTMIYCCGRRTAIPGGTFKTAWRTTVNGVQIIPEEDTSFENPPGEVFRWTQWTRYEVCEFTLKQGDNVINMHFLPGGQETATSYGNDMYVDYIAFDTSAVLKWSD